MSSWKNTDPEWMNESVMIHQSADIWTDASALLWVMPNSRKPVKTGSFLIVCVHLQQTYLLFLSNSGVVTK